MLLIDGYRLARPMVPPCGAEEQGPVMAAIRTCMKEWIEGQREELTDLLRDPAEASAGRDAGTGEYL